MQKRVASVRGHSAKVRRQLVAAEGKEVRGEVAGLRLPWLPQQEGHTGGDTPTPALYPPPPFGLAPPLSPTGRGAGGEADAEGDADAVA